MGDGIAMGAPTQEEETSLASNIEKIKLEKDYLGPRGIVTDEGLKELSEKLGVPIKRLTGGAVKNVLLSQNGEIILLLNTPNENLRKMLQAQVELYKKHSSNEAFKKIVAPIKKEIVDQGDQVVGMTQEYLPNKIQDLKKASRNFSKEQWVNLVQKIKDFTENYAQVIAEIGIPQGDFVFSEVNSMYHANWDNIRLDQEGNFYFLDYNGQSGRVRFNGEDYHPGEPFYQKILENDPKWVQGALMQYFGLNTSEGRLAA